MRLRPELALWQTESAAPQTRLYFASRTQPRLVLAPPCHQPARSLAVVDMFDYVFAENGLRAYKNGALLAERTIKDELGEDNLKAFVNYTLKYLADVEIPVKRGTFIEFRTGMLNVSPVGRNCSQEERDAFEKYDAEHGIRKDMVKALEGEFGEKLNLKFSVGGQISFDVFPKGWDKTYCLQFVKRDGFKTIHFFGDKTYEGGNDHEIFASDETEGHTVVGPEDTLKQCGEIFG